MELESQLKQLETNKNFEIENLQIEFDKFKEGKSKEIGELENSNQSLKSKLEGVQQDLLDKRQEFNKKQ